MHSYKSRTPYVYIKQVQTDQGASFNLKASFLALVKSAEGGCMPCRIFYQSLVYERPTTGRPEKLRRCTLPIWVHGFPHNPRIIQPSDTTYNGVAVLIGGSVYASLGLEDVSSATKKDDGCALDEDSGSQEVLNLARHWLRSCTFRHPRCAVVNGDVALPTRIINVGSAGTSPFLFVTNGAPRRYCALSYCWGGENNFAITTMANLEERKTRIPTADRSLPRTIRDAIHITRHLRLQFIWIDALCIVQDDPSGWDREASRMVDVYQNAYCTLNATGRDHADQGLL